MENKADLESVYRSQKGDAPLFSRDGRIRVLHLNYSLDIGGIETLLLNICRRMNPAQFQTAVCSMQSDGQLKSEFVQAGIPVFEIPKEEGVTPAVSWRLASLCRREGIHLLHSHNYASWFYGVLSRWCGSGARIVHTEHSRVEGALRRRILAERVLSHWTGRVVAVSESVSTFLGETVKVDSTRLRLVPNGVDVERFRERTKGLEKRKELGITEQRTLIGIVARLVPVKRHEVLFRAFKRVEQVYPNTTLLVVGDGPLRTSLISLAHELGIRSVMFLGNRRDIPELLECMDVFTLCSESEGYPITLLEAMAAGKAVVATSVGGCKEIIRDGINGILVPAGDSEAFADALEKMLSSKELRLRLGSNARKEALQSYNLQSAVEAYENFYRELFQARRGINRIQ